MFCANINELDGIKFEGKFKKAIDWLKSNDLKNLACGRYVIDGNHVFATVVEYESGMWKDYKYETHNKYYDLQLIVTGDEFFGYTRRKELKGDIPYNPDRDIEFYHDPEYVSGVALRDGDFIIVSPLEGHKPNVALNKPGHIKKVVVKIEY